jgi:hypothetical protein
MENTKQSKTVRNIIILIGVTVVALSILFVGIRIGERKARFAGQFGDNFERNFVGPRGGMMDGMMGGFFSERLPGGHGAIGEILSVNLPQIVITGPDNLEKTVLVGTSTTVRLFQENVQGSQLKVGDFVVVIGDPNSNGQIEARLIRIMPQK